MLMIRPLRCARRYGSTSRVTRTSPKKLVSKSCWAWAVELSSAAPRTPNPALLTRTSMRPARWTTVATAAATDSSSVTSSWINSTPAIGSVFRGLRLVPKTSKPFAANALATAGPIPQEAPGTNTTGDRFVMSTPSKPIGVLLSKVTLHHLTHDVNRSVYCSNEQATGEEQGRPWRTPAHPGCCGGVVLPGGY